MKIAIFGASGQGREIADICSEIGYNKIVFLTKDKTEKSIWDNLVIEDTPENVDRLAQNGFKFCIGVGEPKVRSFIAQKYPMLDYPNIIHPSATFGLYQKDSILLSHGNIITAGVRFTNNIQCGNFCLFNLNATVAHDSIIDDFVSIMADVNISGNVHIKQNVYLGVNSTILQGGNDNKLVIGKNSIVGAGAVVTRDVSDDVTVVGIPAKPLT